MKLDPVIEGKKVKIVHTSGEVFTGIVADYIYPEDNEPEGIAGIVLDDCPQRNYLLGMNETEIESIEVIE